MIYLASSSPRRHRLLREAGIRFKVLRPRYEEKKHGGGSVLQLTRRHALGKALSVAARLREGIVLGADTVVLFGTQVLGKPRSMRDAGVMLSRLAGHTHRVVTTVALLRVKKRCPVKRVVFTVTSRVRLKKMTPLVRGRYLKRIRPLDKAGAYAAQAGGPGAVESVRGSFTNVVGLPIEKLKKHLRMLK